jgi:hypothetical protein
MAFINIAIAELSEKTLDMLRRRVERTASFAGDVYPDEAVPADLDYLKPGNVFGRFRETIIRREVRREGIPAWFDPQHIPGQQGVISRDGVRCYIELELNLEARNAPSTFEAGLLALTEDDPEQTSLLI